MDLFQKEQEVAVVVPKTKQIAMGKIVDTSLGENKLLINCKGAKITVDMDDVVSVDGFPRKKPVYYQPRLTDEEFIKNGIGTFEVYRHFRNAKDDYPDHIIDVFEGSDIEDHTYIDDEDGRSLKHYVDIPNPNAEFVDDFTNIYQCFDRDEAILYARLNYNADENGMVNIISQS